MALTPMDPVPALSKDPSEKTAQEDLVNYLEEGVDPAALKEAGIMGSLWRGAKRVGGDARGALGTGAGIVRGLAGTAMAPLTSTANAVRFAANPIQTLVKSPVSTLLGAVQTHGALTNMGQEMRQAWEASGPKVVLAEVTGSPDMPLTGRKGDPVSSPLATVRKVAEMNKKELPGAPPGVTAATPTKEQPESNPQAKPLTKKAERYALPGRYPLDSYEQVKSASAYFSEFGRRMQPSDRHEYCVNLVKRASELAIELPEIVRKYGSEKYASPEEISASLEIRRNVLQDDHHRSMLDKLAGYRPLLQPELFSLTLAEFDKVAGIDHMYESYVPDPYYSTFGAEKTAKETDAEYSDSLEGLFVTGPDLAKLGQTGFLKLKNLFGEDFAKEFQDSPVDIYKSMPREQKKMLIRMANENAPGVELNR